jgi:hypothetical protein
VFERGDDRDEGDCFGNEGEGKRVANLQFSSLSISKKARRDSYLQELAGSCRTSPLADTVPYHIYRISISSKLQSSTKYSNQQGMSNVKQTTETRGIRISR